MVKRTNKTISLDIKKLETFEKYFPTLNFSRWVEDCMGEFIAQKAGKPAKKAKPHTPVISERKQKEQEDAAFLRGVEEYLERGEKLPERTMEEYKRIKEAEKDA